MKTKKSFDVDNETPDTLSADDNNPSKIISKNSSKKIRDKKKNFRKNKALRWTIKITIITFLLAGICFIASEYAGMAHYAVSIALLVVLLSISIIFDGIGVAVTSCNPEPIYAMASRKEPSSKQALVLIKNAERVSNICCDVIGDICGIVSGACLIVFITKVTTSLNTDLQLTVNIIFSSLIAAITVGGKAIMKDIAVNKSKEMVLITARVLALFYRPKDKIKKKKRK